jgi:hypothetical protein
MADTYGAAKELTAEMAKDAMRRLSDPAAEERCWADVEDAWARIADCYGLPRYGARLLSERYPPPQNKPETNDGTG